MQNPGHLYTSPAPAFLQDFPLGFILLCCTSLCDGIFSFSLAKKQNYFLFPTTDMYLFFPFWMFWKGTKNQQVSIHFQGNGVLKQNTKGKVHVAIRGCIMRRYTCPSTYITLCLTNVGVCMLEHAPAAATEVSAENEEEKKKGYGVTERERECRSGRLNLSCRITA